MADNGNKATYERKGKGDKKDTAACVPGVTEARTNDPNVDVRESAPPPERAVAYQTLGVSDSAAAYPLPGSVGVVQCDDKNDRRAGADEKQQKGTQDGDESHAHKTKKKLKHMGRNMPRWPALLSVCVLSLVCGIGGAWGYTALFAPSQSDDQGEGSGKGGKSSDQGGTSDKSEGGASGGPGSDQSSEVKDLKENMEDLDDGITQLTARLDRLTETIQESRLPIPEYYSGTSRIARMGPAGEESPPIRPNALPTQLNVLERRVEQMSDLPSRVRTLEELVATLRQEIETLAARSPEP